ncbi:MAG TPA: hypothetical protein VLA50_06145 [Erythrobacter sp.]|nr:hypothetical protein [Erythrobacter sp.]
MGVVGALAEGAAAGLRVGLGLGLGAGRAAGRAVVGCGRGGSVTSGSGVSTGAGAIRGGGALRGGITTPARSSAGPSGAGVGVGDDCGSVNPPDCDCAASGPASARAAREQAQMSELERIIA